MPAKPYLTYTDFLSRHLPGLRLQKVAIDGGFTCPNRDGTLSHGGCAFCLPQAFAPAYCREAGSITAQIEAGKRFFAAKHRGKVHYLIYLQSYSATYAPAEVLRTRYEEALNAPDVVGIVIGTRPDCLPDEVLDLLQQLHERHFVMVEVGIESCYDRTLQRIGRGHTFQCASDAIHRLAERGIPVGAHLILGLPGESRDEMLHQADLLSALPIEVLKLHQLQVMRHTRLADEWQTHPERFHPLTAQDYAQLVAEFITRLRPDIALDRFVSESPSSLVLAPRWGLKPQAVQQMIEEQIRRQTLTFNKQSFTPTPMKRDNHEESEYEKFRRMQIEQFEDDITEGRCYPEMPEGQFIRSK